MHQTNPPSPASPPPPVPLPTVEELRESATNLRKALSGPGSLPPTLKRHVEVSIAALERWADQLATQQDAAKPTASDRQCAKNILSEFVHTHPPADFMEDRVTNHVAAHVASLRSELEECYGKMADATEADMAKDAAIAAVLEAWEDSNRHLEFCYDLLKLYDDRLVQLGEPKEHVYEESHVKKMHHIKRLVLFHKSEIARLAPRTNNTSQ